tara:strand:- start:7465 stop:9123 length:1659 start_codon:yes stop_codon:yes gene_type:complete
VRFPAQHYHKQLKQNSSAANSAALWMWVVMTINFLRARAWHSFLSVLIAGSLALALVAVPAEAGPESDQLIKDAIAAGRANDYETTLKAVNDAIERDANDVRPWLLKGVAENRLGRFDQAAVSLDRAVELGADTPRVEFERGWAAVELGEWQTAIAHLTQYEALRPGDGKTSELLGRSFIGTGDLDKAEQHLNAAITRDPSIAPRVGFSLARIAALRGDTDGATERLLDIVDQAPDSAIGQAIIRDAARRIAVERVRERSEKPWFVALSAAGGYASNVIGLANEAVLPSDISSRSSQFVRTTLDAGYSQPVMEDGRIDLSYGLALVNYLDLSNFNTQNHRVTAQYRHRFRQDLIAGLRVFGGSDVVDDDVFLNQVGISPTVSFAWRPDNVTSASVSLTHNDYRTVPTLATFDRDGSTRTASLSHEILIAGHARIRGGVSLADNDANGSDFDYESNAVFVRAQIALPLDMTMIGSFASTAVRYQNLNSQAGAGFAFKRRDSVRNLGFELSRPLEIAGLNLAAFLQHNVVSNDSNIAAFTYQQRTSSIGLRLAF